MYAQNDASMGIIPAPVSVEKHSGFFVLDKTTLLISAHPENARVADLLNAFIASKGGFALRSVKSPEANHKAIVITSEGADKLPEEGYHISITKDKFLITGKGAGLFYAVQSVMQLMPEKQDGKISVPAADINDYPRFKYRGMHLDVGCLLYTSDAADER